MTPSNVSSVVTIAGLDALGNAGVSRDIATFEHYGILSGFAATCQTLQSARGVDHVLLFGPKHVARQLRWLLDELHPLAIKIGLIPDLSTVTCIARALRDCSTPIVLDPVFAASSGGRLVEKPVPRAMLRELVPLAYAVTPNICEAEILTGRRIRGWDDVIGAGEDLLAGGARNILIKGGHGNPPGTDILFSADGLRAELSAPPIPSVDTWATMRGSGCAFSSALAAETALGRGIFDSACGAKRHVRALLRSRVPR